MKKSLLAVALLGAFGVAAAQSNVSIYGILDAGVQYTNGDAAGSKTSLESGQQSFSRIGFKGTEDLGNGLNALFVLEQQVEVDTGAGDGGFTSQAYVGFKGSYGQVTLGRQLSPLYMAHTAIDPFKSGFAADMNNTFGSLDYQASAVQRMDNAAIYATPEGLNGFKASFAYGFGEQAGSTSAQSQIGALIGYDNGPLTLVYGFHQTNNDTVSGGIVATTDKFNSHFFGGTYDFGMAKLHAALDQNKVGDFKSEDYMVGVTVPFGANEIFADYTHKKFKDIDDSDADQFAIGYSYKLSPRTNLYTAYTYVKNDDFAVLKTNEGGKSVSVFQFGVRHTF